MTTPSETQSVPLTFMRNRYGEVPPLAVFGPKPEDHPTVGFICITCGDLLQVGDYTTIIALGPGRDDQDARTKAANNNWYSAIAIETHLDCAMGVDNPDDLQLDEADPAVNGPWTVVGDVEQG